MIQHIFTLTGPTTNGDLGHLLVTFGWEMITFINLLPVVIPYYVLTWRTGTGKPFMQCTASLW